MKQVSNKDMLNAIRNEASAEYRERIPVVENEAQVASIFDGHFGSFPSTKNEFIDKLMNKVVKSEFFSKVYENPLKMLKKGTLPYGSSIEELFVQAATAKGFYKAGFNDNTTGVAGDGKQKDDANDLTKKKPVVIKNLYIEKNYAYVFEASISDAQLRGAFFNANGLSELVNQIVGSLLSGAEQQEFEDMKKLVKAAAGFKYLKPEATGLTEYANIVEHQGVEQVMAKTAIGEIGTDAQAKKLAKTIRTLAGKMRFPSTAYNMAKVKTWSRPEDLVLLVTPETLAELDVEVLADAFNVSKAEVGVRTIVVDELPKNYASVTSTPQDPTSGSIKTHAILMDRSFIQAIDTVNETRQFENGRALLTNMFLHKQGIMATCYFGNCVAITNA